MKSKVDSKIIPRELKLTERQLFDLEMILLGGFQPLQGFLNEEDYLSVVEKSHLHDGRVWPMPIVLDINEKDPYRVGDKLVLCDMYGNPRATFHAESRYTPNKEKEALMVYGTTSTDHPGVAYLMNDTKDVYLGGRVEALSDALYFDFLDLRKSPKQIKQEIRDRGIKNLVGFQTRNPLHKAHYELIKRAAKEVDGHVLIHPVVGLTKPGDIEYKTRVRAYKHVHEKYAKDFTLLSLLPLAMRMAGPREALWHALIRKNYGCTHFIIGRDHAGPGKDSSGKPFYGLYDAQDFVLSFGDEIGITILPSPEIVYSKSRTTFLTESELEKDEETLSLSGTEFRERLFKGIAIPDWFSFPEVIEELRKSVASEKGKGFTLFFTGLSGAGKSTIAGNLAVLLEEKTGRPVTLLDGDIVRTHLSKGLGFSDEDRNTNIERIGYVASEVTKHGGIAICAAIAPFRISRAKARNLVEQYGAFIEVYVSTPLEVCKARDTKGLYEKALRGDLPNFTGVSHPYEEPRTPELSIDTQGETCDDALQRIMHYLESRRMIDK